MNIRITLPGLAALTVAGTVFGGNYKLTVPLTADDDGAMIFLTNYDTGAKVDSVLVEDGKAVFTGTASPFIGRLSMDGKRSSTFFVEDGDITFDMANRNVTGGVFNGRMKEYSAAVTELQHKFAEAQKAGNKAAMDSIYSAFQAYSNRQMLDNLDNVYGLLLFLQQAYDMEPAKVSEFVAQHPVLKDSKRVQRIIASNNAKLATQPGKPFVDFEVTYNGKTHKLSDVVGKGKYVLVDFWASWCGPCRREMPNLKQIASKYGDRLKVLGVAVWDEPDNTLNAVKELGLPWEIWPNGQYAPTDAYGILGIPCIILFGPDGTILVRDLQGEELSKAIDEQLSK